MERMMRGLECIGRSRLVTTRTHQRLRTNVTHSILRLVKRMTVGAGNLIAGVGVGAPVRSALRVARETLLVLHRLRRVGLLAESNHAWTRLAFAVGMQISWSMTGFAL
jgi:hypothetical protein